MDPDAALPTPPGLLALEYVVEDDQPLQFFRDLLGYEEIARYPHTGVDAEVIQLAGSGVMVNLIRPTAVGDRPAMATQDCHLSQVIFTVPDRAELHSLTERLAEAGVGVVVDTEDAAHVGRQASRAIFGVGPAPVFVVQPPA